jgi:hypothetical protein
MNLPETFYIALCVTILLLGAIYWFWTQLQYIQRKVNLLDNVVYEMKTLVSNLPGQVMIPPKYNDPSPTRHESPQPESTQAPYAPPPESVAGDLEAERMASELEFEPFVGAAAAPALVVKEQPPPDELQPGGLASPNQESSEKPVSDASIESPLASMSIKELRRMAEANGIPGSNEMRKRDLIRALRDKVSTIVNPVNDGPKVISFDDISAPDGE